VFEREAFCTSTWTLFDSIFIWLSHQVILVQFELGLERADFAFLVLGRLFWKYIFNRPEKNVCVTVYQASSQYMKF